MIPIEIVLNKRKNFPLIQNSYENFSEEFSDRYSQLMSGKEKLIIEIKLWPYPKTQQKDQLM